MLQMILSCPHSLTNSSLDSYSMLPVLECPPFMLVSFRTHCQCCIFKHPHSLSFFCPFIHSSHISRHQKNFFDSLGPRLVFASLANHVFNTCELLSYPETSKYFPQPLATNSPFLEDSVIWLSTKYMHIVSIYSALTS